MAKDLTIILENKPGSLARIGEALGKAGMNIEGVCAITFGGEGIVHVLVEDGVKARRALKANQLDVTDEQEVLVLEIEDRPAALGNMARRLANAGVNVKLAYMATSTRLVIGANNLEKARAALATK